MMARLFQLFVRSVRSFLDNNCSIHAAGLTYFAMLALIPVLCCILVAAKACHVDRYAREQINAQIDLMITNIEKGQDDRLAAAAGTFASEEARLKKRIAAEEFAARARRISDELFERVEKFDVKTLGWIGFVFLLWTVISSLGTVETSFNQIWHVPKPRPIWKRSWLYLFILIVLPVMMTAVMSLPVLKVIGIVGLLDSWFLRFVFILLTASLSFGFFFWVMPNCRVAFLPAWLGGVLTSLLLGGWVRLCAVAQVGIAKSSALYGSFAFLPIVLAWLYMSWQIVLFGACFVKTLEEEK